MKFNNQPKPKKKGRVDGVTVRPRDIPGVRSERQRLTETGRCQLQARCHAALIQASDGGHWCHYCSAGTHSAACIR